MLLHKTKRSPIGDLFVLQIEERGLEGEAVLNDSPGDCQIPRKALPAGKGVLRPLDKPISTFKRRTVVQSSIEGDNIKVKYVTCPRVPSRNIIVGKGCKIDLVQYSDKIEISRSAKIGKIEKI